MELIVKKFTEQSGILRAKKSHLLGGFFGRLICFLRKVNKIK
jgi:hypothetical protein